MFPEAWEYSLAPYMDALVKWMVASWGPFFDTISNLVLSMLMQIEYVLKWMPWWGWILLVTFISWRLTKTYTKPLPGILVLALVSSGYGKWLWRPGNCGGGSVDFIAVWYSLGIAMASYDRFNTLITPVLDAMQTMPSLVYLIRSDVVRSGQGACGLRHCGLCPATGCKAYQPGYPSGIHGYTEAALAFGASTWQMLKEVRLPLAMPSILAGINQTTMLALSMVVIASMIGAGGLGEEVLKATNRVAAGKGFEAGWAIVVLAIVIDRISQATAKSWNPQR